MTGSEGVIESPLYPLLLVSPEPFTYTWTITVAEGSTVEVSFDVFDLEHSYSCYYTRLAVHEGLGAQGRELFGDCVYTPGIRIVSSENVVTVILTGEDTHYGVKFRSVQIFTSYLALKSIPIRLRWKAVSFALLTPNRPLPSAVESCGGDIELAPDGNITRLTSPNWPENYPHNLRCEWVVKTQPGSRVRMRINSLVLESHFYGCQYDRYIYNKACPDVVWCQG